MTQPGTFRPYDASIDYQQPRDYEAEHFASKRRELCRMVCRSTAVVVYGLALAAGIGLWIAGNVIKTNGVKIWDGKMELAGTIVTSILAGIPIVAGCLWGIAVCCYVCCNTGHDDPNW